MQRRHRARVSSSGRSVRRGEGRARSARSTWRRGAPSRTRISARGGSRRRRSPRRRRRIVRAAARARTTTRRRRLVLLFFSTSQPPSARQQPGLVRPPPRARVERGCCARTRSRVARAARGGDRAGMASRRWTRAARREWCAQRQGSGRGGGRGWDGRLVR